jgi:hypothetical protein
MGQITELFEVRGMLLALSTRRGRGGVLRLQDGTKKSDKLFNYSLKSASNQPQVG